QPQIRSQRPTVDTRLEGEVELVEGLYKRKARLAYEASDPSLVAVGQLFLRDPPQILGVAPTPRDRERFDLGIPPARGGQAQPAQLLVEKRPLAHRATPESQADRYSPPIAPCR